MDDFNKTLNLATNISNEEQFRLNKINDEIKDYFLADIRER